jgi:hypothetical protein
MRLLLIPFIACLIGVACALDDSKGISLDDTAASEWDRVDESEPLGEEELNELRRQTCVVTASSGDRYFARLQNFIGSLHVWEPTLTCIIVHDLGMSEAQAANVSGWRNVRVLPVNFAGWPGHVRTLWKFAWKPLVMWNTLEAMKRGDFGPDRQYMVYLDAGEELRAPLDLVLSLLHAQGFFYVVQDGMKTSLKCCGRIGELTRPETIGALRVGDERMMRNLEQGVMCAGGIQGYRVGHPLAHLHILRRVCNCALSEACIAPSSATKANHRFDQSVFSTIIHQERFSGAVCERDPRLWANRGNARTPTELQGITSDPLVRGQNVLFSRRGWGIDYDQGVGQPYARYIEVEEEKSEL